jgi:lipase chaperone LimK
MSDGVEHQRWPKRKQEFQAQEEVDEQIRDLEPNLPKVQQYVIVPQNNEGMLPSVPSSVIGTNVFGEI